ncbi:MAG TPA: histidinol dehydrogenase [Bacteroidia bacterium]
MQVIKYPLKSEWQKLTERPIIDNSNLEEKVQYVLDEVKSNGDAAIKRFTLEFDRVELENFMVSEQEFSDAEIQIEPDLKEAIDTAYANIKKFHIAQKETTRKIETMPGVECWRTSVPIEKVGLYIPGGTAPLFSTLLMLGIPAVIAGCKEISICTPADKQGKINPAILYVAKLLRITTVYKIGGAQAIAAFAYGTETVSKVYKIFGPGNQYVTCAKQLVAKKDMAIDIPAGPSELLVLADGSCVPAFVAADLLSQAEHGIDSQVILVSDSEKIISEVVKELNQQVSVLPRTEIALKALENSKAILFNTLQDGITFANQYAPEHLIIACEKDEELAEQVINAGSVFLGNYTPESAGDYASGTNHTLPTNGYAKAYSGVSLDSFVKKITFQKISKEGIHNIGKTVELMADKEGLRAHKNAVSIRLKNTTK